MNFGSGNGIEELIKEESGTRFDTRTAVCVVKRRLDGYLVNYVCPLRLTGLFAEQGAMTKLLCGSDDKVVFWDEFLVKHQDIVLRDGDTVEFTLIDTVSPFDRLAPIQ